MKLLGSKGTTGTQASFLELFDGDNETIDKIERDIYAIVLNEYGINLMVSATIFPLMAATYVAGLQVARETRETVNMYNIFEIDVVDDDMVILTPLSTVKQYLKNDSKK